MDLETKAFYDDYWHRHVPIYEETRRYVLSTVTERDIGHALDAGCGHGLCSIALSEISDAVTGIDVSDDSLRVAVWEANKLGRSNIEFLHDDLQSAALPENHYDVVWCWGVAMMTPEPLKVLHNIMRSTKPGGVLYLGVYLKTWVSPFHQASRAFCRRFWNGPRRKLLLGKAVTLVTTVNRWVRGGETNLRPDNRTLFAQVEDWFYPPFKTFYSKADVRRILAKGGFEATHIQDQVGRLKSATIFVTKATKTRAVPNSLSADTPPDGDGSNRVVTSSDRTT